MKPWPKNPLIYEINTWVWLRELSDRFQRPLTLNSVPDEEWDRLSSFGADAIWFMGVWERSPAGIRIALGNEGLMADFRRALPDVRQEDVVGSPYCIRRYVVDGKLGGPRGLAVARRKLRERGVRMILDFVPNHVAPDHPWVSGHPEYFIGGTVEDLHKDRSSFIETGGNILACGRDPYFPAWPDVLQLNAFNPGLRRAAADTVAEIAGQCDGIRCDMAMLLLNHVFERTWGGRAGDTPDDDYWRTIIPPAKRMNADFKFIAEAYWDLEWDLQQQGFDFCYDKRLYDRLEHGTAEDLRLHLTADPAYQKKLVRFIENHDEPRAAAAFSPGKERAAATVCFTLTGAKLLHEGQTEGMRTRLPVFLGRRPVEPARADLVTFYDHLLKAINHEVFRAGHWQLCDRSGWPDNQSFLNALSWSWVQGAERRLIVVNYSDSPAQMLIHL
ncbi:MAG TPA: alpha-amylase, partial [Bacteroidota bacterium]|nr:alpha-amylase [Bacteroidota bacterium]